MSFRLRPYQAEAFRAVWQAFHRHRSTLVVLPTGTGKTVLFSELARRWDRGRVLVMAHRDELIAQSAGKIAEAMGERPAVEQGEERSDESAHAAFRSRVVVASVQTMSRPHRLARFNPEEFGLCVTDEAHHAVAKSYRAVYDHFGRNPAWRHLGVTATPKRSDDLAMGQVFESVAYEYGLADAVADGWLCPVRQRVVVVEGLDFSRVRSVAGDFHQGDLEALLTEESGGDYSVLHQMAAPTVEMAGDHRCLVFCVGVHQAKLMAAVLNRYKPRSADWISGETPKDERRAKIAAYKSGEVQFICNCAVLTEGFDCPETTYVVMGRPTRSLTVYMQALGRATRPWPGCVDGPATAESRRAAILASPKPCCVVLDFAGNAGRFAGEIVTAADVLGGKYGDPVRQYAKRTAAEEGGAASVEESLDRAEAELTLLAEEEERRRLIKARVAYRTEDVGLGGAGGERRERDAGVRGDPATNKQVWKLRSLGVSYERARSYTRRQASAVIGKLLADREAA